MIILDARGPAPRTALPRKNDDLTGVRSYRETFAGWGVSL